MTVGIGRAELFRIQKVIVTHDGIAHMKALRM